MIAAVYECAAAHLARVRCVMDALISLETPCFCGLESRLIGYEEIDVLRPKESTLSEPPRPGALVESVIR